MPGKTRGGSSSRGGRGRNAAGGVTIYGTEWQSFKAGLQFQSTCSLSFFQGTSFGFARLCNICHGMRIFEFADHDSEPPLQGIPVVLRPEMELFHIPVE